MLRMFKPNPSLVDPMKEPRLWFRVVDECAVVDYFNNGGTLDPVSAECFTDEEVASIFAPDPYQPAQPIPDLARRLDHIHDNGGCVRCKASFHLAAACSGRRGLPLRVYDPDVQREIRRNRRGLSKEFKQHYDQLVEAECAKLRAGKA